MWSHPLGYAAHLPHGPRRRRVGPAVRTGAHLGDAAGREVERVVAVRADVDRPDRFPLRTEHAGRRTCDGLAVLAADPATLGLDSTQLAGLDELRAVLDAYGDLPVAEPVHRIPSGPSMCRNFNSYRSEVTISFATPLDLPRPAATTDPLRDITRLYRPSRTRTVSLGS